MLVLINFDKHKIVKVVSRLAQAEYWAEILCKGANTDVRKHDVDAFARLSMADLMKLYRNLVPGEPVTVASKHDLAVKLVSRIPASMIDRAEEDDLAKKLGRTLQVGDGVYSHPCDMTAQSGTVRSPTSTRPENDMPRKKATEPAAPKTKAKAKAPAAAAERIEQNGIVRPRAGGKCARVWEIADSISKKARKPAELAAVLEATDAEELNPGNTRVEYQRWRKFNGLGSSRAKAA